MEKSPERLLIIEKIKELEAEGKFDIDVEPDPPTVPLKQGEVDYLGKKLSSKFKSLIANIAAKLYFDNQIRKGEWVIKRVNGIENYLKVQNTGVILTCNHFNPNDNYAIDRTLQPYLKFKRLYKIIREGNYTSFKGLYGFFFRNCNTIPLPSSLAVWREMSKAVDQLLKRGEKILVYPEQAMWWNYRKPRPLKSGAFKFAVKSNAPVLPIFITMEDTEKIGADGFPVQAYTINFSEPIYPDPQKSQRENANYLAAQNFEKWKNIYEAFYGVKLAYTGGENE